MKVSAVFILMVLPLSSLALPPKEVNRWKEDIDVYSRELASRHIDLFHSIQMSAFFDEIERIKSALPQKTTNEVYVDLMMLTHSINDGHTSFPLWGQNIHSFPFELKGFGEDLFVVRTSNKLKMLLGAKLIAIEGIPSSELYDAFSRLTPFTENEFSTSVRVAEYIPKAEILNGLGIIQDSTMAAFTFEVNGKAISYSLPSKHSPKLDHYLTYDGDTTFTPEEKIDQNIWFGASPNKETIYFKFRRYTSISKMDSLAEDLLSFIKKNASQNLIIDLRDNYGGDFFVGLNLAHKLILADSINWLSGVFVLINDVTFSAAMSNAAQFTQILNATLVGTPTGGKPSGYQDMGQFTLPNSKLEVTYSKRLYHFKENQKDALYPDVHIEVSINDYKIKNDRQLNWILNHLSMKGDIYTKSLQ